jgi:spoIIIJ-associated protein
MIYEFEGRTEKEAIDRAAEELGLEKGGFDVEILETQRSGLFKKGFVKIQVQTDKPVSPAPAPVSAAPDPGNSQFRETAVFGAPESQNEFEQKLIDFVEGLVQHMGYGGKVSVLFREDRKIGLKIDSEYSSILIGKKGKNLDALQLFGEYLRRTPGPGGYAGHS